MIRHVVLVSFKPEASADQTSAWHDAVTELCKQSPEVLSFSLGRNIGSGPNHHDAALVADFADMESFRRYVGSDQHKAYVENHARQVTAKLAAIQHEI
ncbi:Dabb family protein [Roseisalinus antarcticus]|uniref:Stress responsive A/B Barrel Domain protein n=1 Tax=Roseisalinus antarcticus TaxID=254357 RepID=A0A1Y5T3P1_9RHOB|nr:Dabb family protein [Roseisalinus antarcticus]SLN53326.1 Stress responsive A/B Barrel Domain protein [Roseisalinus antarcticus]